MRQSSRWMVYALGALALIVALVWWAAARENRAGLLTVAFLDVGQGDAIFIDAPSGRQVLIDGGRGARTLRSLSSAMPWYDRSIDLVIATHPDTDHIGGLIDVFGRYRIGAIVLSSVLDESGSDVQELDRAIREEGIAPLIAHRGQIIDLGVGAYIEVLFPDRSVPDIETNTGSVVAKLVFGETSFLLSGDAPDEIEEYLVAIEGERLKADVLKAGHHGSNTSSSPLFLGYVDPAYAVFSRGCDNSYGHPAPEVAARYSDFGIPTLDTCIDGTVTFVSDGTAVTRR